MTKENTENFRKSIILTDYEKDSACIFLSIYPVRIAVEVFLVKYPYYQDFEGYELAVVKEILRKKFYDYNRRKDYKTYKIIQAHKQELAEIKEKYIDVLPLFDPLVEIDHLQLAILDENASIGDKLRIYKRAREIKNENAALLKAKDEPQDQYDGEHDWQSDDDMYGN